MKKNIYQMLLLIATVITTAACSSDSENEMPAVNLGDVQTPIRITANYAGDNAQSRTTRVAYSEDGDNVSATWQAGDQLYVVYNGHVNTLNIESGTGETTATFSGSIIGTPTSNSILICYVRDANNPSAVNVTNTGEYTYASGIFASQDGTLAGAAKCNLYYGTTTYGTGENISCDFQTNTSLMKFTVFAPDGVSAGDAATLSYKSDGTELAKASFTVGENGINTIYMTVPAGQYTGEQTLVYNETSETLSATKANFTAGETYSKSIYFGSSVIYRATSSNFASQLADFNTEETAYPTLLIEEDLGSPSFTITRPDGLVDFNGHSHGNDLWIQSNEQGKEITITNGIITKNVDGKSGVSDYYQGTVIFDNMTVTGTIFTDGHVYIFRSGTYNKIEASNNSATSGTVTIYGGRFNSITVTYGNPTYILYGGKYTSPPTGSWCASGYSIKWNTDDDAATYPYIVSAD